MPFKRVKGVGVDLISLKRAREFVARHRDRIYDRLLSPSERKNFSRKNLTASRFARLFSAKEAYFKALGGEWMGVEGFAQMELAAHTGDRFHIGSLKREWQRQGTGEGCFFENEDYVGAQVIVWK